MTTKDRTQGNREQQGRSYLAWLRHTLADEERFRRANRSVRQAVQAYAKEHRGQLGASWAKACWVLFRTTAAIAGPMALAGTLGATGHGAWSFLLVPVTATALFGVMSIVHDTVHGTFLPSRRGNRLLGTLLAPLVLLDFASFHRSHMAHHRHSQAMDKDPKRPLVPAPKTQSPLRAFLQAPIELWLRAVRRLAKAPSRLRHAIYLMSLFALGLPVVLLFAGEVSLRQRQWHRRSTRLSLLASLAIPVVLAWVSPVVGLYFAVSLWGAMGWFFGVFLTHISPFQLYMVDDNPAIPFFSLNISDIDMGPLVGALGNTFTEHHAAHHLMPYVPSYRLRPVGDWVEERFATQKAPSFRLWVAADFNLVADTLVDNVTASSSTLIPWQTAAGAMRRLPIIEQEQEAPISSQRWWPHAA